MSSEKDGNIGADSSAQELTTKQKLEKLSQQYFGMTELGCDLLTYKLDKTILGEFRERVPRADDLMREEKFIPVFKIGDVLTIAMVNPDKIVHLQDLLPKELGWHLETLVCLESGLNAAFIRYTPTSSAPLPDIPDEEEGGAVSFEDQQADRPGEIDAHKLEALAKEGPVIKWVNQLIVRAIEDRASDIHVEPTREGLKARFRIDGILQTVAAPQKALGNAVISRIKVMSHLDIAERRVPQDGRYGATVNGREIDFRVSTFPTAYGEAAVMRILDRVTLLSIDQLGFSRPVLGVVEDMISEPNGVILVTGPTGSGKTTSLYAFLNTLATNANNVMTMEDPVEYDIDNLRQSQINKKAGYTYAKGMGSILRQDPDVIFIGEIRDKETGGIVVEAALTGQLVFSTIHTNDAPSTITRLIDMGVEPFLVSSAIQGVIAQRLIRVICSECKRPYHLDPAKHAKQIKLLEASRHLLGLYAQNDPIRQALRGRLEAVLSGKQTLYAGTGCESCRNTGFRGRIGVFSVLRLSESMRDLIVTRPTSSLLRALAIQEGMDTLWLDGLDKVFKGMTTVSELRSEMTPSI